MRIQTKILIFTLSLLLTLGLLNHAQAAFTCGDTVTFNYLGNIATSSTVTVGDQCWMDRNLGATQAATAYNDTAAYGHYFQWGRLDDGHQVSDSGTTATLSTTDRPGHDDFITNGSADYDWHTNATMNDDLWGSANDYINNPCPAGWHVPSQTEWASAMTTLGISTASCGGSSACLTAMANSSLKIPAAGYRYGSSGALSNQGTNGNYWSSSPYSTSAYALGFNSTVVYPASSSSRANGFTVRCLQNDSSDSSFSYILGDAGSQTINIYGNLTVGDESSPTSISALTYDPALNVYGNVLVSTSSTLVAPASSAFTVGGNWTNYGTFTANSGTVTFSSTTAAQTLSGTMIGDSAFHNLVLMNNYGTDSSDDEITGYVPGIIFNGPASSTGTYTITTGSVRVEYQNASTYEFNNINWNGQAAGTMVYFRNSSASGGWKLKVTGTQTAVDYVNVSRSDACVAGGSEIEAGGCPVTNYDGGNNGCWTFTAGASGPAIRMEGTIGFEGSVFFESPASACGP